MSYRQAFWHKRCTIRWTQLGDENTKYFHVVTTDRYRRNNIAQLKLDDGSVADTHVQKEVVFFFKFLKIGSDKLLPFYDV